MSEFRIWGGPDDETVPQDTLAIRDAEIARLRAEVESWESVARTHDAKSPFCEHPAYLSHSDDGGKHIHCYGCQNATLKAQLAELRELADRHHETLVRINNNNDIFYKDSADIDRYATDDMRRAIAAMRKGAV
jgi:hypothetical protein